MVAYRCLRCGCLHGWFDHPSVARVRTELRQPIVAGSLPAGTTGVNETWLCPRCGTEHINAYGPRPLRVPQTEEVRVRAHELWEASGHPPGDGVQFWLTAERELQRAPTFEMVEVS
jgi:hypothetical protein